MKKAGCFESLLWLDQTLNGSFAGALGAALGSPGPTDLVTSGDAAP
jgi:hypothetical protein